MKPSARRVALALLLAFGLAACKPDAPPPLRSEAYVWQRSWGADVPAALREARPHLAGICILWREVTFTGDSPKKTPIAPDLAALAAVTPRAGFAIRLPSASGGLDATPARVDTLAAEIASLKQACGDHGIEVTEIQIDYDCPTRHLSGYAEFLTALRRRVPDFPVVPTVLPSWLDDPAWPALARAGDGFVLQVHGLERPPPDATSHPLCDPAAAQRALTKAARVGVPFRLALPTYESTAIYGADGRLRDVISEDGSPPPSVGERRVEFRSDAAALAGLVRALNGKRPRELTGLIWYRLPVPTDRRNWRLVTFLAVIAGRSPQPRFAWQLEPLPGGSHRVVLENSGDGEGEFPSLVSMTLPPGKLVAFDALAPYAAAVRGATLSFERTPGAASTFAPDTRRAIGWLRVETPPPPPSPPEP